MPDAALPLPLVKTDRLDDPFVVAGDRAYLIGQQDGGFPHLGSHVPGEMAGLWAHPHKLLDGFWCALATDPAATAPQWLPPAARVEVAAWGATQWFELPDQGLRLGRTMVVPDGRPALLVELRLVDMREQERDADRQGRDVEVTVLWRSDLRPGWLDPRPDQPDEIAAIDDGATIIASDPTGPWWVACGSLDRPQAVDMCLAAPEPVADGGAQAAQRFRVHLPAGGEAWLRLGVHGGTESAEATATALRDLLRDVDRLVAAKFARLSDAQALSRLDVPDDAIVQAWGWTRCTYDWLVRDVPGVGRGLGAGLPEYPWWFGCDNGYALRGLLPLGGFEVAAETLRLLAAWSQRHNGATGRIIHELSCTGHVFNPGNTQETPQFVCALLEAYLWSGDRALVEEMYPLCRQGVLSWTLGQCDADGDLLPEGYGITEVEGLNTEIIDSAVWTHEALRALGRMAGLLGDAETSARCANLAPRVHAAIEQRFWQDDESLYADWIATPRQARPRLERMLESRQRQLSEQHTEGGAAMVARLEAYLARCAALPQDEETAWPLANAVVITPLEAGLAARERAERALARLESAEFYGPSGVYLSGIERGWAMSVSTGYLAAAESAYGRIDQAVAASRLLATMVNLRMPGAISEMSPDGGCFVQAWSGYGLVYPIIYGVFGLYPDAEARHIVLCPRLPAEWPSARITNVQIGDAHLDLAVERAGDGRLRCTLRIDRPGWRATLLAPSDAAALPPLTLLGVHSARSGEGWRLAPELAAAGTTIELAHGSEVAADLNC